MREPQLLLGSLDPSLRDVAMRGEAGGLAKHAGKVIRAEAGFGGKVIQGDIRRDAGLDEIEDALQPFHIDAWRLCGGSPASGRIGAEQVRRQRHLDPVEEEPIRRFQIPIQ
ncbi:hypothetical protein D3C72_1611530 [compost metagenome]